MSASSIRGTSTRAGVYTGWLVVLAAFCGVMVSFGSLLVFTFSIFLKPLSAEFGWSRESVSGAFGIAAMTVALCSPGIGWLLDRYGPRPVILPCMLVFGAAFASLSLLTPQILHLYVVFFVLGAVGSGTTQMGYSRAVSSWFTEKRGMALALVVAGSELDRSCFRRWPSASSTATAGALPTLRSAASFWCWAFPSPRYSFGSSLHRDRHAVTNSGISIRDGLRSRAFWVLVAILFLSSIAIHGAITHFSAILSDRGLSTGQTALALSVLGAMSLCGRLITGHLLDRFFGPWISLGLLAGAAGGIVLLSWTATPSGALASAGLIGLGLGGEADGEFPGEMRDKNAMAELNSFSRWGAAEHERQDHIYS